MPRYEIWHTDDAGNRIALLNTTSGFDYTLVDGDVGWLNVAMPYDNTQPYDSPQVDQRIHIYRAPDYSGLQLAAVGFLRRWGKATENNGLSTVQLGASDPNELPKRRIVAYYDRTNQSIKDGPADDVMKAFARENFGSLATDTARDMSALGISIDSDLSLGPDIGIAAAHENLLGVLQEIQQTSRANGDEVFWRIRASSPSAFVFETKTGQPGSDRTFGGNNPLFFGTEFGNIINAQIQVLYDDEQNYIYAGGQGDGVLQNIQSASDAAAIAASRWNRREGWISANQADTVAKVEDAAMAGLTTKRAQLKFVADLIPTDLTPFGGTGWWVGDKITVSHLRQQFDAIIRMARVVVNSNGLENVAARVEAVL